MKNFKIFNFTITQNKKFCTLPIALKADVKTII